MKEKNDNLFMKKAILEAVKSKEAGEWAGGAVIVKNEKVISQAENKVNRKNDPTAHAEIEVIRKVCKRLEAINLKGCTLYTTAEPCPMCMAAIIWSGLDKLFFGVSLAELIKKGDSQIKINSYEMNKRSFRKVEIEGEILKKECKKLFLYC